jgi:HD superfamily phosphodiesterase
MVHHAVEPLVILTACYFHDIVSLPKNHPERSQSSRLAARKTSDILRRDFPDFPPEHIAAVAHAIEAHSFSAGIAPQSMEAKIVQDADRLEALGAIGLARVFAVSGALGVPLLMRTIPLPMRVSLTTGHLPSTIFRPSCCVCLIQCKRKWAASWHVTMPIS